LHRKSGYLLTIHRPVKIKAFQANKNGPPEGEPWIIKYNKAVTASASDNIQISGLLYTGIGGDDEGGLFFFLSLTQTALSESCNWIAVTAGPS